LQKLQLPITATDACYLSAEMN